MSALNSINARRVISHVQQHLRDVIYANITIGEIHNSALAKERIKEITDDFLRGIKNRGAITGCESSCERVHGVALRDTKRGARVDCLSEDGKVLQTVKYSSRRYARKRMQRKVGMYVIAWEVEPQPMQVYQIKVSI